MTDDGTVTIRLLGPFEAARDGHPLPLTPLERGIVALLALSLGRVVSVEALAASLWTGEAPAPARTRVHTLISSLRRKAGAGHDDLLAYRAPGYLLRAGGVDLGVAHFDH